MADLSPALATDLDYALAQYGLTVTDVPRDHEGRSIVQRVQMLDETGSSYRHSTFRKSDLRNPEACLWELFPENPATVEAQSALIDEVGELLHREHEFRDPPGRTLVRHAVLPRPEHLANIEQLLAYVDGTADAPAVDLSAWGDAELIERVLAAVPHLRDAEQTAALRATLIDELASGAVPPASAVFVRRALDSESEGLRNADITVAAHAVTVANLRDALVRVLEDLRPHVAVSERIRQVRDDLDRIDDALHWPGAWVSAPTRKADALIQ